jgi:hypothetical protein
MGDAALIFNILDLMEKRRPSEDKLGSSYRGDGLFEGDGLRFLKKLEFKQMPSGTWIEIMRP